MTSGIRSLVIGAIAGGVAAWTNWDGRDEATMALALLAANWAYHRLFHR